MTEFCDAHNHLQDERFGGHSTSLQTIAAAAGVTHSVVNGVSENDWPEVARLAARHPGIVPSFGYHPWYLPERTDGWREVLEARLATTPRAVVGEIGLDRWWLALTAEQRRTRFPVLGAREPATWAEQMEAFRWQWELAVNRHLPASVHCLQAWGPLLEFLSAAPRVERGFLLHSFGGPVELVRELVQHGAYFGFPGYFLHEQKHRQREVFRAIPADRLLIETDAPDQLPPPAFITHPLIDPSTGRVRVFGAGGGGEEEMAA